MHVVKNSNIKTKAIISLKAIISILSLTLICAGCDVYAIPGFTKTDSSTPTGPGQVSEASQYPYTSVPVGTLPLDLIGSLGTGLQADIVFAMAGLDASQTPPGRYRFLFAENHEIICELQIVRRSDDLVLLTGIQSDVTGHKLLFSPKPDDQSIDDFQINSGSLNLDVGEYYQESILRRSLGEPLRVAESTEGSTDSKTVNHRSKTLYYRDLTIDLRQDLEPAYSDFWLIVQVSCTSPDFSTPRGLAVGVNYQEALGLLGTGDFILNPDALPTPARLSINKADQTNDGANKQIELMMRDGKIYMISIIYTGSH